MNTETAPAYRKVTIGEATLYCGDSLALLQAGVFGQIGAIVSDPPYGIGFVHGGGGRNLGLENKPNPVQNLDPIHGDDAPFDPMPWVQAAPCKPVNTERGREAWANILLWGADWFKTRLPEGGTLLAWDKHLGRGPDDSFADCEWAWCGRRVKREVFRHLWKGIVAQRDAWDMPPPGGKGGKGAGAQARRRGAVCPRAREPKARGADALEHRQGAPLARPAGARPVHGQRQHRHCCAFPGPALCGLRDRPGAF